MTALNSALPNANNSGQANAESRVNFGRSILWFRRNASYYDTPQLLTAAGAISPSVITTILEVTGGTNVAFTLAAPLVNGQRKIIHLRSKGGAGNAVVTVTNGWQFTTLTLDTARDSVFLESVDGGWAIEGNQGATVA